MMGNKVEESGIALFPTDKLCYTIECIADQIGCCLERHGMAESTDTTILSPGSMLVSDSEQMIAQILLAWLTIPNDREERRFLERHPELLGLVSECILNDLIAKSPQDKVPSLRDHLKLLLDGRARGGTAAAIREAYVNMHGGFNLDLPPWLEEVKEQFDERIASGRPDQTAAERVALLRGKTTQSRQR